MIITSNDVVIIKNGPNKWDLHASNGDRGTRLDRIKTVTFTTGYTTSHRSATLVATVKITSLAGARPTEHDWKFTGFLVHNATFGGKPAQPQRIIGQYNTKDHEGVFQLAPDFSEIGSL